MKVTMFTNTYLPHVGGVARSVSTFQQELSRLGHDVRVVAPQFEGAVDSTERVLRTPALPNFNGSDFSLTLPQPGLIAAFLDAAPPDILHSHHPFLLGDSALRAAWTRRLPLVFTHHTLYEQYTRYTPLDSEAFQRIAVEIATGYANLCTHVIAPSRSLAEILRERGVTTPITVLPTGIDLASFASGNGAAFRRELDIPVSALVVGHVGRLSGEKNLDFLARAVGRFLTSRTDAVFVAVGSGDHADTLEATVCQIADPRQVRMVGSRTGRALADAYAALDLFVFSSQSETQGLVLAEAMAAGAPVVALDGPGVRDIVTAANGRLLPADAPEEEFSAALSDLADHSETCSQLSASARRSAAPYGVPSCTDRLLALYGQLIEEFRAPPDPNPRPWDTLVRRLEIEWNLLLEKASALGAAVAPDDDAVGNALRGVP
jgi:glycosyltransferase involved in cell wall biosynthesis